MAKTSTLLAGTFGIAFALGFVVAVGSAGRPSSPAVRAQLAGATRTSSEAVSSSQSVADPSGATFTEQQAEFGILLQPHVKNYFSCNLQNIQFPLLGPLLSNNSKIQVEVDEYDGAEPGGPNDLVYYSDAVRKENPSLPANTLTTFTRGKQYMVETDTPLVFQCGRNLDTVYACGNGITEGEQAQPSGFHAAEQCDGGPNCNADCTVKK